MSDEAKDPFEGESKPQVQVEAKPAVDPTAKKVFTKADIKRFFTIKVALPFIYTDFAPWEFDLRLKLSGEAEDRRQEYLALGQSQQTVKLSEQALDEICDLLVNPPRGFGDLLVGGSINPGTAFRKYVETETDEATKALLLTIVEGASNLYWGSILPREFRG
jgi:hypothetical protein